MLRTFLASYPKDKEPKGERVSFSKVITLNVKGEEIKMVVYAAAFLPKDPKAEPFGTIEVKKHEPRDVITWD